MNRTLGVGIALSVLGVVGYVAGVAAPYPGRSFSVTAVMVGLTLVAIGRAFDPASDDADPVTRIGNGDGNGNGNAEARTEPGTGGGSP